MGLLIESLQLLQKSSFYEKMSYKNKLFSYKLF